MNVRRMSDSEHPCQDNFTGLAYESGVYNNSGKNKESNHAKATEGELFQATKLSYVS